MPGFLVVVAAAASIDAIEEAARDADATISDDDRAELALATTDVLARPAEEREDGGAEAEDGAEAEAEAEAGGGGDPVIVTVLASTTVLVTVIVEVDTVVRASCGWAKASGDEKRNKRALKVRFARRIVMGCDLYGKGRDSRV